MFAILDYIRQRGACPSEALAKGGEKMNNKLLIGIVALIVVFGAFIFLGNKNTNTPSSTGTSEVTIAPTAVKESGQITNVILGDSDFVPKDITVKTGTTVVWINKSGKSATVNSYDHPTHKLYPFLNLGEFASGSSVQIVVEKAGKYSYHNHLNPSETGTITAE